MTEIELKKAHACLDEISHLASMQKKEFLSDLQARNKKIDVLEEDKRRLNEQVNDLVIASGKHEQENARILIAGLVIGAIVGATGAVIWMGLS